MNLYGLIGKKLGHSISPRIHEEIFEEFKLIGEYKLYEIAPEALKIGMDKFKTDKIKGINVTIPYKSDILPFLDEVSLEAENIGAVNTVNFIDNKLIGYNTDYYGVKITFEKNKIVVKNKNVVILGNGGASAAVIQYLIDEGCKDITFVVRNIEKARLNKKYAQYNMVTYENISLIKNKDILVNCTPCGMFPKTDECPVSKNFLSGFSFVFDLIYNPKETLLLRNASELKIKNCNGLYMLVGQAVAAEGIWNQITVNLDVIDKIYKIIDEKVI